MIPSEDEIPKSVCVFHIVSPDDFWMQLADNEQAIAEIEQKLVEMAIEKSHFFSDWPAYC